MRIKLPAKEKSNNRIYIIFDTANGYSAGTSEEYLGRALKKNIARDQVVIASKVYFNPGRLLSEAIHREIDGTLIDMALGRGSHAIGRKEMKGNQVKHLLFSRCFPFAHHCLCGNRSFDIMSTANNLQTEWEMKSWVAWIV